MRHRSLKSVVNGSGLGGLMRADYIKGVTMRRSTWCQDGLLMKVRKSLEARGIDGGEDSEFRA